MSSTSIQRVATRNRTGRLMLGMDPIRQAGSVSGVDTLHRSLKRSPRWGLRVSQRIVT